MGIILVEVADAYGGLTLHSDSTAALEFFSFEIEMSLAGLEE